MTPAIRLKSVNGMNWQSARIPTATGECVSERMSQACATRCIQVPDVGDDLAGEEEAVVAVLTDA